MPESFKRLVKYVAKQEKLEKGRQAKLRAQAGQKADDDEPIRPEDQLMDAILAQTKPKFEAYVATNPDEEFELSASRFTTGLKTRAEAPKAQSGKTNENQEVYLDRKTGKIVVNPRKSEHTIGVKRPLDRRDREAEAEGEDVS